MPGSPDEADQSASARDQPELGDDRTAENHEGVVLVRGAVVGRRGGSDRAIRGGGDTCGHHDEAEHRPALGRPQGATPSAECVEDVESGGRPGRNERGKNTGDQTDEGDADDLQRAKVKATEVR